MIVEVMASFKVKANGKEIILHPGQRVKFNDTIAERLISEGDGSEKSRCLPSRFIPGSLMMKFI